MAKIPFEIKGDIVTPLKSQVMRDIERQDLKYHHPLILIDTDASIMPHPKSKHAAEQRTSGLAAYQIKAIPLIPLLLYPTISYVPVGVSFVHRSIHKQHNFFPIQKNQSHRLNEKPNVIPLPNPPSK